MRFSALLARATRRIIRQNLGWAFGYNLILIPLAAAGVRPPVLAAAAMATSSVTVVGNALRLRRFGTTGPTSGRHTVAQPRRLDWLFTAVCSSAAGLVAGRR